MYKTFRFRLYPNDNQIVLIHKTLGCYRFIYNHFLNICKNNGFSWVFDMIKELPNLTKEYEWLKEVDIQVLKVNIINNHIWKYYYQIDTYFPSSKTCSHCGEKTEIKSNLGIRKWECSKCHNENDRDINASINIMFEGLKYCFDK